MRLREETLINSLRRYFYLTSKSRIVNFWHFFFFFGSNSLLQHLRDWSDECSFSSTYLIVDIYIYCQDLFVPSSGKRKREWWFFWTISKWWIYTTTWWCKRCNASGSSVKTTHILVWNLIDLHDKPDCPQLPSLKKFMDVWNLSDSSDLKHEFAGKPWGQCILHDLCWW